MDSIGIYCLFCRTGAEKEVETKLQSLGFTTISSVVERIVVKDGKTTRVLRPLLPSYVFLESSQEPNWKEICEDKTILYPLRYSDDTTRLRGKDLDFIHWLQGKKEPLKISSAIQKGTYIKIIDGPLKEIKGRIRKFNKARRCAEVEIETDGFFNKVWLSYELIQEAVL